MGYRRMSHVSRGPGLSVKNEGQRRVLVEDVEDGERADLTLLQERKRDVTVGS